MKCKAVKNTFYNLILENARDRRVESYLKSKGYGDYNERMEIISRIKHDIPNVRLSKGKFLLGICRMFCDGQLGGAQDIFHVDEALGNIDKGNHQDEFDENLNGKSPDDLYKMFSEESNQRLAADMKRSTTANFDGKSRYKVVPINSFEEAEPYGKYTSWCVTYDPNAFETYTEGGKRFYFCLKNGFEKVKKDDEGAPLNNWGLSMIAVVVDSKGRCDRVTTRYNHDHDGENNPGLKTAEQVEKVVNLPFYSTFKPYTREEQRRLGNITVDDIVDILANSKNYDDFVATLKSDFKGKIRISNAGQGTHTKLAKVLYNDSQCTVINLETRKVLTNTWTDTLYIKVNYEYNTFWVNNGTGLSNLLDADGKVLVKNVDYSVWDTQDRATIRSKGVVYGVVSLRDGKMILTYPKNTIQVVKGDDKREIWIVTKTDYKQNYINNRGEELLKRDCNKAYPFKGDIAFFYDESNYAVVDKQGKIIYSEEIRGNRIPDFQNNIVCFENSKTVVTPEGARSFNKAKMFSTGMVGTDNNGQVMVIYNGKCILHDNKDVVGATLYSEELVNSKLNFGHIVGRVTKADGGDYPIFPDGRLGKRRWSEFIYNNSLTPFLQGYDSTKDMYNVLDADGNPLWKTWVGSVKNCVNGTCLVSTTPVSEDSERYNILDFQTGKKYFSKDFISYTLTDYFDDGMRIPGTTFNVKFEDGSEKYININNEHVKILEHKPQSIADLKEGLKPVSQIKTLLEYLRINDRLSNF